MLKDFEEDLRENSTLALSLRSVVVFVSASLLIPDMFGYFKGHLFFYESSRVKIKSTYTQYYSILISIRSYLESIKLNTIVLIESYIIITTTSLPSSDISNQGSL